MPHPKDIVPDPLRPPSMEEIERARQMYAQGFTVARCLAAGNMSLGTLYYWLDGGPVLEPASATAGGRMLAPLARRRTVVGKRKKPLAADTLALVARLTRTLAREALDIEQRLAQPSGATPERERNVRMLASLVQSARVLSLLAPAGAGARPQDDAGPDDIDEFREMFARRIRSFLEARVAEKAAREAAEAGAGGEGKREAGEAAPVAEGAAIRTPSP